MIRKNERYPFSYAIFFQDVDMMVRSVIWFISLTAGLEIYY